MVCRLHLRILGSILPLILSWNPRGHFSSHKGKDRPSPIQCHRQRDRQHVPHDRLQSSVKALRWKQRKPIPLLHMRRLPQLRRGYHSGCTMHERYHGVKPIPSIEFRALILFHYFDLYYMYYSQSYIQIKYACRNEGWPEENVEGLSLLRPYFPIIQRMQTWMHHVSRYDGWYYSDTLRETSEAINHRRAWIKKVAESLFMMLSSWPDPISPK